MGVIAGRACGRERSFCYHIVMKMDRNHTRLVSGRAEDDSFAPIDPALRIAAVWELTREVWSLKVPALVEGRMDRSLTRLIKMELFQDKGNS
jgi:hypothetical protein